MGGINKNTVIGVGAVGAILIAIILYFYLGQSATVVPAPGPAATEQKK